MQMSSYTLVLHRIFLKIVKIGGDRPRFFYETTEGTGVTEGKDERKKVKGGREGSGEMKNIAAFPPSGNIDILMPVRFFSSVDEGGGCAVVSRQREPFFQAGG